MKNFKSSSDYESLYLVKAKLKGNIKTLFSAFEDNFPETNHYCRSKALVEAMKDAKVNDQEVMFHEVCWCNPPLTPELKILKKYFSDISFEKVEKKKSLNGKSLLSIIRKEL